jgi:chemotaxis protein MotB
MAANKLDKHHEEETVIKRAARKGEEDEHGGAWKVAFADFCLALMCLFLVLWVLAARNQEKLEEVMKSSGGGSLVSEGGNHLLDHNSSPQGSLIPREPVPGDAAEAKSIGKHSAGDVDVETKLNKSRFESAADLKELAAVLAEMSDQAGLASNLQSVITPYGLRVMLHDTDKQGMFQRGSAIPSDPFSALLFKLGKLFTHIDNQLLVIGHTDAAQYSGQDNAAFSNWSLSSNRAMAARASLLKGGMPAASILQVVGMAERAPLDAEHPLAAVNRRIELVILTPGQAQLIAQMYGMPGKVVPIAKGVDSALPEISRLEQLRRQLAAHK